MSHFHSQAHPASEKRMSDFRIISNDHLHGLYSRLVLTPADGKEMPQILPGQFVQVAADAKGVLLRRPISVNDVDYEVNTLTLLVRKAGPGTEAIISREKGDIINLVYPLGNGFDLDIPEESSVLLVGGGVGVAPLLYLGRRLKSLGVEPMFLLGARTKDDLLKMEEFESLGTVFTATEDGSTGVKGFVTAHPVLKEKWQKVYVCGPAPMMKAVANMTRATGSPTEVSLENMMACGLGACLCCVENTVKGNVCVCTEGPVFPLEELNW
ncbi:MAG: dihydroorotate dehydrogenase electron transfer subunit [Duncaniella sp.]|nr:dihydroorotate dehydrogenase electron transfer subunit [Duncaniella sp.]